MKALLHGSFITPPWRTERGLEPTSITVHGSRESADKAIATLRKRGHRARRLSRDIKAFNCRIEVHVVAHWEAA